MHYIYGPVKSRRLGASLGINITPFKYCVFDCVYCQLKKTNTLTVERQEYIKVDSVLSELRQFLKECPRNKRIDYITLSGSGEPLLNSAIRDIISGIKQLTSVPVALITNSVLLVNPQVRREILDLDLILPSLDAVTQDIFEEIDRPFDNNIRIENIIEALILLRKEFKGKIWIEIMIIKDINDDLAYTNKFKEVLEKINPDRIQLNIASRPPSESWVKIPSKERLKKIQALLGQNCDLI